MKIIRPVQVTQAGSFTRNSTGTYFDSNGVMRTALANALRVTYDPGDLTKPPYALIELATTNYVSDSENFGPYWSGYSIKPGLTKGYPAPDGSNNATRVASADNNTQPYPYLSGLIIYNNTNTVLSGVFVCSVWARCVSGTLDVNMGLADGLIGSYTLTTAWKRISYVTTALNVAVNGRIFQIIEGTAANVEWEIWGAQVEIVPAGVTQPSSYIPSISAQYGTTRAADVVTTNGLLYSNIPETDYPAWSATTAYSSGDKVLDAPNHKIYQAIGGLKNAVTIPASSTVLTMYDANNTAIVPANGTPVKLASTTTLPSGFNATTTYYVVGATTTAFSLSASVGGAAISSGTAGSGTYTLYAQTNLNKPLNDILNWVLVGNDNRWSMFDQSITSQSTSAGSLTIVFAPGTRMDSVIGLNCLGSKARISMTDAASGAVVYSTTVVLASNSGINNLYSYFYEPIVQIPDFVLDDLPVGVSGNSLVTLTLTGTPTAAIGGLVFGLSKDIGLTEWGTKVSTTSFSVKTQDTFGNYTITPRAFSKRADFTIQVPTDSVDYLENLLTNFRDSPVVYIGYNSGGRTKFNSTVIYGFYKDFEINIAYNAFSVCSLTVEGLT